ncbi:MAG: type II secretion system protein GspN [Leptospiraceae bacterium]|nr:type II secretion system protein GspN [Leptospiraceae bacterium]
MEQTEEIEQKEEETPPEEELKEVRITTTQKFILIFVGVFSFLVFTLLLLPYSALIRYALLTFIKEIKIDYVELKLGIFSPIVLKDFYITNEKNFTLTGDEAQLKLNIWKLLGKKIQGNLLVQNGQIKIENIELNLKNARIQALFENSFDEPLNQWKGSIEAKTREIQFKELMGQFKNLPIPDEQKVFRNVNLQIKMDKGSFSIPKSNIDNPLFKISLQGSGNLANDLANSIIDARICLNPNPNLEEINPSIYGFYLTLGGSMGGEWCAKIQGTISNPKLQN